MQQCTMYNLTVVLHLERKKLAKNSNTIILQPNAHIKKSRLYFGGHIFNSFSSVPNLNMRKLTESYSVLAILLGFIHEVTFNLDRYSPNNYSGEISLRTKNLGYL